MGRADAERLDGPFALANGELERWTFRRNRHRESEATRRSRNRRRPSFSWIASPRDQKPGGRNDDPGWTCLHLALAAANYSKIRPRAKSPPAARMRKESIEIWQAPV
jgi:hypothetical protein